MNSCVTSVNKIKIPKNQFELKEYLLLLPEYNDKVFTKCFDVMMGLHTSYNDGRDILRTHLSTTHLEGKEIGSTFTLDFDYFLGQAGRIGFAEIDHWLIDAHQRIEDVFEGSITDNTRRLFGEKIK